jgi:hypothetical protein
MLKNVDDGALGGDAGDSGAPTINAKKCRRRAPWPLLGGGGPGSIRDLKGVL